MSKNINVDHHLKILTDKTKSSWGRDDPDALESAKKVKDAYIDVTIERDKAIKERGKAIKEKEMAEKSYDNLLSSVFSGLFILFLVILFFKKRNNQPVNSQVQENKRHIDNPIRPSQKDNKCSSEIKDLEVKEREKKEELKHNNEELDEPALVDEDPPNFICPIYQDLMEDPVIAADGHSYERAAIEDWLTRTKLSPLAHVELKHTTLIPNHALRNAIGDHKKNLPAIRKENQIKKDLHLAVKIYHDQFLDRMAKIENIRKQMEQLGDNPIPSSHRNPIINPARTSLSLYNSSGTSSSSSSSSSNFSSSSSTSSMRLD